MPWRHKILIIEDDTDLRELIAEKLLLYEEFIPIEAATAQRGLELLKADLPDLIILDLGLPDSHGLVVLKVIRDQGVKCPIVILTAETNEDVLVKGLDLGANDFVIKPFSFPVFLARIRSLIRHHTMSGEAIIIIGRYTIYPRKKYGIDDNGQRHLFTDKEVELLKNLHRASEKMVSSKELQKEVWGPLISFNTHTLESHIYRLRQKIEPNPKVFVHLITCDGGYKLIH
jgi:DNA-binding response OmpR family regulator